MATFRSIALSSVASVFTLFAAQKSNAQCDPGPPELRGFAGLQYQTTGSHSVYAQQSLAAKAGLQLDVKDNSFSPYVSIAADYPIAGGMHGGSGNAAGEAHSKNYAGEKQFGASLEGFLGFGGHGATVVAGPFASFNAVAVKDGDKKSVLLYPELGFKGMLRQDVGYMRMQYTAQAGIQFLNPDGKSGHCTYSIQLGTSLRF